MLRFPCSHCGLALEFLGNVGDSIVCPNCNTRQEVPTSAVLLTAEEERAVLMPPAPDCASVSPRRAADRAGAVAPEYKLLLIAGWILIFAGPLEALVGIVLSISALFPGSVTVSFADSSRDTRPFLSGMSCMQALLVCFVIMGFGQLLHAIRDVARNSWRSRAVP